MDNPKVRDERESVSYLYFESALTKRAIQEKGLANVLPALDELLDAVQVYNPKLYKSFLRKL